MKETHILLTAILAASVLCLLLPTLAVAQNETPIVTSRGNQQYPAIWGDIIVWQDDRNSVHGNLDWDIYMYDISTGEETRIPTGYGNQTSPAIYGSRIVYEDDRNGDYDIYMYVLNAIGNREFRITTNTADQYSPEIYGDRIVWVDDRNGNYYGDIYLGDLAAQKEIPITTGTGTLEPAIWGNVIAWSDIRNGYWDIYMYNVITGIETPVATYSGLQSRPAIWGDRIVYEDERNIANICAYTISTGAEYNITNDDKLHAHPAIYGDWIVWQDYRNGNADIYLYQWGGGNPGKVTTDPSDQTDPKIYDDKIVWQDYRYGDWDIFMYTIPKPPICDFAANVTSGQVPLKVGFTDQSKYYPTSWSWDFGDGSPLSSSQNPVHTYNEVGIYSVTLTVTNAMGSDVKTMTNWVEAVIPEFPSLIILSLLLFITLLATVIYKRKSTKRTTQTLKLAEALKRHLSSRN